MLNIGQLSSRGQAIFLQNYVRKMGLEGALIATAEGLEMASFFNVSKEADIIAADMASLLSSSLSLLSSTGKGGFSEMIIDSDKGAIAIKNLGDDIVLGILAPEGYKLGGLLVSLKQFVKELQTL
jgi:predicted regulator of Ras-like GTPase activity (Roadblock/LC7/MglB family)